MAKTRAKKSAPVSTPEPTTTTTPTALTPLTPDETLQLLCANAVIEELDSLNHDPANARTHPERNVEAIVESLRQFGQDQPLVVQREGRIVRKGNGRMDAMRRLGWKRAVVVWVDDDNWQAVARALADNRASDLAEWDTGVLGQLLSGLQEEGRNVAELGWTEEEVQRLSALPPIPDGSSAGVPEPAGDNEPPDGFKAYDEDIPTDSECPKCGFKYSAKKPH